MMSLIRLLSACALTSLGFSNLSKAASVPVIGFELAARNFSKLAANDPIADNVPTVEEMLAATHPVTNCFFYTLNLAVTGREWANRNGYNVLVYKFDEEGAQYLQPGGIFAENRGIWNNPSKDAFWNRYSEVFARQCSGEVLVGLDKKYRLPKNDILTTIELPILKSKVPGQIPVINALPFSTSVSQQEPLSQQPKRLYPKPDRICNIQ